MPGYAQKGHEAFLRLCRQKNECQWPTLLPGCPEGSWLCEGSGAFSLNSRDLFGKRARRAGGLGMRQGAGP